MTFHKGDIARCVNAAGVTTLVVGRDYRVLDTFEDLIMISAGDYRAERFVKAERTTAPTSENPNPQGRVMPSPADPFPGDRKQYPLARGLVDYFPDALAMVARCSLVANEQHHPGTPLHWDRRKSTDEADCLLRHFVQRGTLDTDGLPHSAKVAWRALAALQREIMEARGVTCLGPGGADCKHCAGEGVHA